jgi:predicted PurR-regulated permease PerM
MLNRAASSPTWPPSRWAEWRRGLSTRQAAILLRYVLVVAVFCAAGCLYIWQVNTISIISNNMMKLERQARDKEAANALLMQQLAQWESPAYIDQRVRALGMTPAGLPLVVKVPGSNRPQAAVGTGSVTYGLVQAVAADPIK